MALPSRLRLHSRAHEYTDQYVRSFTLLSDPVLSGSRDQLARLVSLEKIPPRFFYCDAEAVSVQFSPPSIQPNVFRDQSNSNRTPVWHFVFE